MLVLISSSTGSLRKSKVISNEIARKQLTIYLDKNNKKAAITSVMTTNETS
ncbi:hypothetical protein B807_1084 [Fructilactobacillus florum 2F]|nr:hypothetical protein B807_1084 [Fructilactobacillus florum 2F]